MPDLHARIRGCLLGLALGDAVGAPYEGATSSFVTSRYPTPESLFLRAEDGPIHYTDDTQMMIGVCEALIADGEIQAATLCQRFAQNYIPARGYGRGARRILEAMEDGKDYAALAEEVFPGGSFGNGAAMRVAPVGLLFRDDLQRVAQEAAAQSRLTHLHLLGIEGAQLIACSVAIASRSDAINKQKFLEELRPYCLLPEFSQKLLQAATIPQNRLHELGNAITAHESVVTAIACFLTFPESFVDAVGTAIHLGGDTDTLAAMTGAISGAYLGEAALPKSVLQALENGDQGRDYICQLADQLWERYERQQAS